MRHQAKLGYGQNKGNDNKLNYDLSKLDKPNANSSNRSDSRISSNKSKGETDKSSQSKSPKQVNPLDEHHEHDFRQDETSPELYGFYQLIDDKKELKAKVSDLKLELYNSKTKIISLEDENSMLKEKLWRSNNVKADLKNKTAGNPCKLIDGKWTIESDGLVIKMDKKEAVSDEEFWR